MKIAILGTGNVATTLGAKLVELGHDVTFGSRSSKPDLPAPSTSPIDAVRGADVVINATPGTVSLDVVTGIGAEALGTTVLIDVSNTFDGTGLAYPNDSVARHIQDALPNVRVVKTLNMFAAALMVNPDLLGPSTVFLAGNDSEAKDVAKSLLAEFGWPADAMVDLGGIEAATGMEAWFLLFWPIMRSGATKGLFSVKLVD